MSLNLQRLPLDIPPATLPEETRSRLGDILLSQGQVDPGEMTKALVRQRFEDARLGELLTGMNLVSEQVITDALGQQAAMPVINLKIDPPSKLLGKLVSAKVGIRGGF